ncbi:MAG: response regulator, partial [Bdellovibrionia bacterium]
FNMTPQSSISLVSIDQIISGENFGPYEAVIVEPNDRIATLIEDLIKKTGGTSVRLKEQNNLVHFFSKRDIAIAKKEAFIIDFEYAKNTLNRLFSRYRREKLEMSHFVFLIKTTASADDIEKLAEFGIKNFLFKPVKPIPLIDSIRQACTGITIDSRKEPERVQLTQTELPFDERRLRILVVDDSKDNQFLIKAYLGSNRYRLVFADNGKIAVDKFKEARFDIVLMDLQMPEMDGYTASSLIREWETAEFLPPTPLVAVSAHDHEYQSERFINAKFAAYLVKPISPYGLRKAILDHTQYIASPKTDNPMPKAQSTQAIIDKLESELAELVPEYLKNRKAEIGELRQLIEKADFKKMETIGHRLKGNAKSYGFEDLGKLGGQLESASREKDPTKAGAIITDMEKLLAQVSLKNQSPVA